jgi:DivIVA domain-containing protein
MPDFGIMLRGYDQREVDELLGRIEATLDRPSGSGGEVTADGVRRTSFTVVMRGYDPAAVDDVMRRYLRELERRERHSSGQWRTLLTGT